MSNYPIVLGSRALLYHNIEPDEKYQMDLDIICFDKPDVLINNGVIVNKELYNALKPHCIKAAGTKFLIPNLVAIKMFKLAHMNRPNKWSKHWNDLVKLTNNGIGSDIRLLKQFYWFLKENYPLKKLEPTEQIEVVNKEFNVDKWEKDAPVIKNKIAELGLPSKTNWFIYQRFELGLSTDATLEQCIECGVCIDEPKEVDLFGNILLLNDLLPMWSKLIELYQSVISTYQYKG
jgi:hypothetical protein